MNSVQSAKIEGMNLFNLIICFFGRLLLSLRYKVEVRGLDKIPSHLKGALILPNHPAYIDPILIGMYLWPKFHMRPIGVEYVVQLPVVSSLYRMMRGISIPSLDSSINQFKIRKARKVIQTIADQLKQGDNFLIYPRGRLRESEKEDLRGASGTQEILQNYPETNILLVRTTGLWGSSFSRGFWGGEYPELKQVVWAAFKTILKNGIFFTPRRKVLIELEMAPADFPRKGTRLKVNRYLEDWYNKKSDPLTLVPTCFWDPSLPQVPERKALDEKPDISIPDAIRDRIYEEIRKILETPGKEITPSMYLSRDLGMDSLNISELVIFLTHNYTIQEIHPDELQTVRDVFAAAMNKQEKPVQNKENHFQWPEETNRPDPLGPVGHTFPEAFLNACEKMGSLAAIADDTAGVVSYKKLKRVALVLSRYFAQIPESRVAVMLPSSVGAYTVIIALHLAGKTPVMLNWTLGPRYLEEMMQLSGAKTILSSWRFLERLSYVDFGATSDQIQLLEDARKEISFFMKLKGLFLSFGTPRFILRALKLNKINPHSPAVILFTSGTESTPKGVPLSHDNILTNLRDAGQCIKFCSSDISYGVLPPFHSFGFSAVGLYPIFAGVRTVFYPDPTDGFALAQDITHWKVTYLCLAPTFLKGLFSVAKKEQLASVHYFITGAEKTPPELYEQLKKWNLPGQIYEGYGITECSPGVSINRPGIPIAGVGKLFGSVELCTIHPETGALLPKGAPGEICLRGASVFRGYLGKASSPFIEINGQQWYRTGDVGYMDANDMLILTDRLKRFVKVGGEMISLGAVESALVQGLKTDSRSLAVIEGEPGKLVLFITFAVDRERANEVLLQSGLSRLIKISTVKQIAELPLMGTGKINYRELKKLCS